MSWRSSKGYVAATAGPHVNNNTVMLTGENEIRIRYQIYGNTHKTGQRLQEQPS